MKIEEIELIDGPKIPLTSFTVIIGTNAVGKTTFLREIFWQASGQASPNQKWIKNATTTKATEKEASILTNSLKWNSNLELYTPIQLEGREPIKITKDEYVRLINNEECNKREQTEIIEKNKHAFFSLQQTKNRLAQWDKIRKKESKKIPIDPVNILWTEKNLLQNVQKYIWDEFRKSLHILDHDNTDLEIGITENENPTPQKNGENSDQRYDQIETWKKQNKFIKLIDSGDGICAVTKLILEIHHPANEVILIDEPELFLYPKQRRSLAQYLSKLAEKQKKQLVIVTHDATFLHGIMEYEREDKENPTIIRLGENQEDRNRTAFWHSEDAKDVKGNQIEWLENLFHNLTVITESPSDRYFYQNAAEKYQLTNNQDIGWTFTNGKYDIINCAKLYQNFHIPFSILVDFDALLKKESESQVSKFIKLLVKNKQTYENAIRTVNEINKLLAHNCNKKSFCECCSNFKENESCDECNGLNARCSQFKKNGSCNQCDNLKSHGIDTPNIDKIKVEDEINKLKNYGIHVVKKGELESWGKNMKKNVGRYPQEVLNKLDLQTENELKTFLTEVITRPYSPAD